MSEGPAAAVATQGRAGADFSTLVYVTSALVIVNYLCSFFFSILLVHQVRMNPNGWPMRVLVHSSVLAAGAFFFEMLAINLLYLRMHTIAIQAGSIGFRDGTWSRHFRSGVGTGLLASLVAVPALLLFGLPLNPANLFIQCPSCLASVSLYLLYLVGIPVVAEVFFRGIFLKILNEHATPWAAVLASTLFFAAIWPLFNPLVGVVVGLAAGMVYQRTRNLLACTMVNLTVSTACGLLLVLRGLGILR